MRRTATSGDSSASGDPATSGDFRTSEDAPTTGNSPTSGHSSTRWRLLVPAVTFAAGLLFSASFSAAQGTDLRSERGLPSVVREADRSVAEKAARVRALQEDVERLTAAQAPYDARVSALQAQAAELGSAAGTRPVRGPVVTVSLDDAHRGSDSLPPGVTVDDIVVHEQDVQAVVNALWRGGAEAMTIQDQRVIATSSVRCVGNTLLLHGRVYSPPFVISALGDPRALRAALETDRQVAVYRQWVDTVGLGYEVTQAGERELPAYGEVPPLQYATVRS